MKKYSLIPLIASLVISISPIAYAATYISTTAVVKKASTPTPTPIMKKEVMVKIEYTLPYPGILPDNPLYFLKQLRDGILDRLIVDPTRKVEFYILQADKRLAMGIMLVDQKKNALAEQTISKGTKYLDRAVGDLANLKNSGKEVSTSVVDRLEKSIAKQIEVVGDLLTKVGDEQKSGLQGSLDLLKKLQQDLAKLK